MTALLRCSVLMVICCCLATTMAQGSHRRTEGQSKSKDPGERRQIFRDEVAHLKGANRPGQTNHGYFEPEEEIYDRPPKPSFHDRPTKPVHHERPTKPVYHDNYRPPSHDDYRPPYQDDFQPPYQDVDVPSNYDDKPPYQGGYEPQYEDNYKPPYEEEKPIYQDDYRPYQEAEKPAVQDNYKPNDGRPPFGDAPYFLDDLKPQLEGDKPYYDSDYKPPYEDNRRPVQQDGYNPTYLDDKPPNNDDFDSYFNDNDDHRVPNFNPIDFNINFFGSDQQKPVGYDEDHYQYEDPRPHVPPQYEDPRPPYAPPQYEDPRPPYAPPQYDDYPPAKPVAQKPYKPVAPKPYKPRPSYPKEIVLLQPSSALKSNAYEKYTTSDYRPSSVPGTPGRDYPNFTAVPETSFDCLNLKHADYNYMYSDKEAGCQVFHSCHPDGRQDSFLCPLGTIFDEETQTCDWWFNARCI